MNFINDLVTKTLYTIKKNVKDSESNILFTFSTFTIGVCCFNYLLALKNVARNRFLSKCYKI